MRKLMNVQSRFYTSNEMVKIKILWLIEKPFGVVSESRAINLYDDSELIKSK